MMTKKAKSVILLLVCLLLVATFSISIYARNANIAEDYQLNIYRARVVEVTNREVHGTTVQTVTIRILNRDLRGTEATINNTLTGNYIYLSPGNRIIVHAELDTQADQHSFFFEGVDRQSPILWMVLIFVICVIAVGKTKGIKSLISLAAIILLIIFGLIPLLLRGYDPIILSILACILATIINFGICFGISKKSISATIGVAGGLVIAGVVAYVFSAITRVGFAHGDAQMLQYLPGGSGFNFRGLLFAGIIIATLGACLDVAISISSSLTEIRTQNPNASDKDLIKSGFNIGRDIMGTMVNTLILVYTGSSLSTILILIGFDMGFSEIINLQSIATEIISGISGSMGLIFVIPATIFAFIFINRKGASNESQPENKTCEKDTPPCAD
ncbi:MAG: YibE/F family protein [Oscillospiraceae bacterium]|nr:YibE/F family protein [Oscillospiraceae bacterium]